VSIFRLLPTRSPSAQKRALRLPPRHLCGPHERLPKHLYGFSSSGPGGCRAGGEAHLVATNIPLTLSLKRPFTSRACSVDFLLVIRLDTGKEAHPKLRLACFEGWPKTLGEFAFRKGSFRPFSTIAPLSPKTIVFGQVERIPLQRDLSGRPTCTSLLQGLPIAPRHPRGRIPSQFGGVVLQFGKVMEGIGLVQIASMDHAHVEIAHLDSVFGLIKKTVFTM